MTDLSLAETWTELTESLEAAGLTVETGIPAAAQPGTVIVTADDPYLEQSDTFAGGLLVNVCLFVIFALTEAEAFTTEANEALIDALDPIPARWAIKGVSAPFKATNLRGLICSRVRISTTTQEG